MSQDQNPKDPKSSSHSTERFKTILVVDDNEFDRKLMMSALTASGGFNILEAASGEQCLRYVEASQVDLILMDTMMPGKYGTEILTEIRKKSNAIELPIIMTTAKAAPADLVSALRLGANDYITKPINFEVALSRVRTHLRLADLSRDMARLQEIATLHAMVVTYNHEINNPLAIALSCVEGLNQRNLEDSASKLKSALWRVAEIVKKIQEVSDSPIEYAEYARGQTMIRLKK